MKTGHFSNPEVTLHHELSIDRGPSRVALDELENRDQAELATAWHEAHLEYINREQQQMPSRWHPVARKHHREKLGHWAVGQGHESPLMAERTHALGLRHAHQNLEVRSRMATHELQSFRQRVARYPKEAWLAADHLLRNYGMPDEFIESYNKQARGRSPEDYTLTEWLAGDATDQELESTLRWSGETAKHLVENTPAIQEILHGGHGDMIQKAVASGKLASNWMGVQPKIKRIVVGDMFDLESLAYNGGRTLAQYRSSTGEVTIWPYEYAETGNNVAHSMIHEINHAVGGLPPGWLDEALTERFTIILEGGNPRSEPGTMNVHYGPERTIVQNIYDGADNPIGDFEASGCYAASQDRHVNKEIFRQFVKKAYNGLDVIGVCDKIEQRIMDDNTSEQHVKEGNVLVALTVATDLLVQIRQVRSQDPNFDVSGLLGRAFADSVTKGKKETAIACMYLLDEFLEVPAQAA